MKKFGTIMALMISACLLTGCPAHNGEPKAPAPTPSPTIAAPEVPPIY